MNKPSLIAAAVAAVLTTFSHGSAAAPWTQTSLDKVIQRPTRVGGNTDEILLAKSLKEELDIQSIVENELNSDNKWGNIIKNRGINNG